ncbi:MAG: hypothetical protein MHMPM18_004649 [Marteilia pararefringens]
MLQRDRPASWLRQNLRLFYNRITEFNTLYPKHYDPHIHGPFSYNRYYGPAKSDSSLFNDCSRLTDCFN